MTDTDLRRTALHALHARLGARFTPFAGYEMPVQYADGVLKEHEATRRGAGLFDVGHMGQIVLRPRSGDVADAAAALERLVPVDVVGLKPGRQRYGFFTNDAGGILDDLMIARRDDHLFLVVNAARKDADLSHLQVGLGDACHIELLEDRGLIALQGPKAAAVLAELTPGVETMRFMDVADIALLGADCVASRSGYSGEDGFEISVPNDRAEALAERLLTAADAAPVGLGARDSLRLEAGLCLYGADLDETTTPVEAALEWAIQRVRRAGGARAGGFPGADRILKELETGAPRRRIGLTPDGRAPMRAGVRLFADETAEAPAGVVTSGGFGPSLGGPLAMGYVSRELSEVGRTIFGEVRGKRLAARIAATPFVRHNYKRA